MVSDDSNATNDSARSHTGRCVGLQGRDNPRLRDFIRTAVLHIDGGQQEHVTLLSDPRGNSLHDFPIDRLLVICDEVLIQEFLDLVRGQPGSHTLAIERCHGQVYHSRLHPADILNNLDVIQGGFLELQKFCRLL